MTLLLTALFWLVVTVQGDIRYQAGPMTGNECALQMAFHMMQVRNLADESGRLKIKGRIANRDDIDIACKRGERAL